jgi:hypothetical protein
MIDLKTLRTFSDALRTDVPSEQYRLQREAWERNLPEQFTLGGSCAGHHECSVASHREPAGSLVFKRDHRLPGLYYADLSATN